MTDAELDAPYIVACMHRKDDACGECFGGVVSDLFRASGEAGRLRAALRRVEWIDEGVTHCPECGRSTNAMAARVGGYPPGQHAPDCALAAALR